LWRAAALNMFVAKHKQKVSPKAGKDPIG